MNDEFFMNLALKKAWEFQALCLPNPAVGAVLLDCNKAILSIAAHEAATLAHAEVLALGAGFLVLLERRKFSIESKKAKFLKNIKSKKSIFKKTKKKLNKFQRKIAQITALQENFKELLKTQNSQKLHEFLITYAAKNREDSMKSAFKKQKSTPSGLFAGIFRGCEIFVSLEPCAHFGKTPPCAELLCALGLKRVIYLAKDLGAKSAGGAEILRKNGIKVKFLGENHAAQIDNKNTNKTALKTQKLDSMYLNSMNLDSMDLAAQYRQNAHYLADSMNLDSMSNSANLAQAANDLLLPFSRLQKNGRFVLFKLALRANGELGGQISRPKMRNFMHNLRANADLLLSSGSTIRADLPRFDCRFADRFAPRFLGSDSIGLDSIEPDSMRPDSINKAQISQNQISSVNRAKTLQYAPSVAILSRTKEQDFPKNAPLFALENRSVIFAQSPKELSQKAEFSGFVLVEGASRLLGELLKEKLVDCVLLLWNADFSSMPSVPLFLENILLKNAPNEFKNSIESKNDIESKSAVLAEFTPKFRILHTQNIGGELAIWLGVD